jgi:membrane fusion protein, multidrug efflux system
VGGLVGVTGPTKLATLVQLDPIYATFTVSEQQVLRIKEAMAQRGIKPGEFKQAVPVEIGLMTEEGYPHAGTLDYVAPMIDPSTGTLTARGILQNSARTLLPGMFLRIRVPLAVERANALLVPDEALGADQSGSYLLVVDKDGMVQQRTVKTGQLEGKLRVISSGIAADDLVVVSGNQKAIPGEKVAPEVRTITADTASAPPGKS